MFSKASGNNQIKLFFFNLFPFTFAVTLCHCQLCILLFWHLIFPAVKIFANVQCPMFNLPALPLLAHTFIFRHFTPAFQSLLFHSSWTKSRLFYFLRYQMNYPTAEWSKQWASERVSEKAIEFFPIRSSVELFSSCFIFPFPKQSIWS